MNTQHRGFYEYKYASLCNDATSENHGNGASVLRTEIVGALGRPGRSDQPISVVTSPHQNVIANVITSTTSPSVKQWHAHTRFLQGLDGLGQPSYASYNVLRQVTNTTTIVESLKDLGSAFIGLNGVRVVNLSSKVDPSPDGKIDERYTTPCDNHRHVTNGVLRDYAAEIRRLNNAGIVVVAATDNTKDNQALDNHGMPFPACLSTTVSVGGVDLDGRAQGALGPHTDFVAYYVEREPISGIFHAGTSFATPLVAAYIAELQAINPTRSANQVLTTLRGTADLFRGSRRYGSTVINFQISRPNFERAKAAVIDSFWKTYVSLINGRPSDQLYGWNYGTSEHDNGVLSYFDTVTLPQNNVVSTTSENGLTTKVAQASSSVLRFSFRPYDIDTADELEILVNDKVYGHAKTTGSNALGATQTVCISGSDLVANGSRNEVKLRLKNSGETWGVKNLKIEVGTVDNACLKAPPTFPNLPANGDRVAGTSEPSGNAYQREKVNQVPFSFNLRSANNGLPTSTTYNGKTIQRDLRVKFTIKSGAVSNATTLKVNGTDVLTTPSITSDTERSYEFVVNRNRLVGGTNTFEFRPSNTGANSVLHIFANRDHRILRSVTA